MDATRTTALIIVDTRHRFFVLPESIDALAQLPAQNHRPANGRHELVLMIDDVTGPIRPLGQRPTQLHQCRRQFVSQLCVNFGAEISDLFGEVRDLLAILDPLDTRERAARAGGHRLSGG